MIDNLKVPLVKRPEPQRSALLQQTHSSFVPFPQRVSYKLETIGFNGIIKGIRRVSMDHKAHNRYTG